MSLPLLGVPLLAAKAATKQGDDSPFGRVAGDEWYWIWKKDLPIPVEKEDKFQEQNRFAFSPLPYEPLSLEGAVLLLLVTKLSKTPEGQKSLERIILKYLDSCGRIIESVEEACHSNWLTALNNQHISAAICHRIGLIDDGGYLKIMDHYRSVFDKMWQAQMAGKILDGAVTIVGGTKVGYGETGRGAAGIGALASILKGLAVPV